MSDKKLVGEPFDLIHKRPIPAQIIFNQSLTPLPAVSIWPSLIVFVLQVDNLLNVDPLFPAPIQNADDAVGQFYSNSFGFDFYFIHIVVMGI